MSKLLPYETIVKVHEGDPVAMNEVLSHYAGYIRYCSHIYGHFNVDMEDYIKTKLIESQFKFRLTVSRIARKLNTRRPSQRHTSCKSEKDLLLFLSKVLT